MNEDTIAVPGATNILNSKGLRHRASMINMIVRQSKSVVALALEDQVAAIDPTLDPEEKLSRLITLCMTSSAAELQQEANDNSDGEDSELTDELATAVRRSPEDLIEQSVVGEVSEKMLKVLQNELRERPMSQNLKALREYTKTLEYEQKKWAERRQDIYTEYKSERQLQKTVKKLTLDEDDLNFNACSMSASVKERQRSLAEQRKGLRNDVKGEEKKVMASLAIQEASLNTAAKRINEIVAKRLELNFPFARGDEDKNGSKKAILDLMEKLRRNERKS